MNFSNPTGLYTNRDHLSSGASQRIARLLPYWVVVWTPLGSTVVLLVQELVSGSSGEFTTVLRAAPLPATHLLIL